MVKNHTILSMVLSPYSLNYVPYMQQFDEKISFLLCER